jgi:phage terminase large subunit-like protein
VQSAAESFPRGNGKSTFSAAIATWAGFDDDLTGAPSVPIVATTVGQAKRSV